MRRSFIYVLIMICILITVANAEQVSKYVAGVYVGGSALPNFSHLGRTPGDTLYSFPAPSTWPGGLAWDGEFFWHSDGDSYEVYKLDTLGNVITSFPTPGFCAGGLAWDGVNLWIVAETQAKLYKIDTLTGTPLESFNLPDSAAPDPNCWGLTWDGAYLWVSRYATEPQIYQIDPIDGEVVFSFPPPSMVILGIAWNDGYLDGVDIMNMQLYKMNPSDSSVVDSIPWQVPYPLGLLWDGAYWWNVSSSSDNGGNERIYKVDAGTPGISDNISNILPEYPNNIKSYPNPFNATTTVNYECISDGHIEITIYNTQGELVKTLFRGNTLKGNHKINWNGYDDGNKKLPGGVYFLKFKANDRTLTSKLLLIR
jgi:hypothetical protein